MVLKWILKKFHCTSSCTFNEELMDHEHVRMFSDLYHLKTKDMEKIAKIILKRQLK